MGRLDIEMIWTICSLKESLRIVISNRLSASQAAWKAHHRKAMPLVNYGFISLASAH
jgi:hypothetical protein